jgi:hypothetical protein
VVRGKKDTLRLKRWPGGPVPLGYRLKKIFIECGPEPEVYSVLEPDPETAWILRKIFKKAYDTGWVASLVYVYAGPGPQAQINDAGDVCLSYLRGAELVTLLWPADEARVKQAERIQGDVPIQRCRGLNVDRQIAWFQLHEHDNRFYLITQPDSAFGNFVRVYEFRGETWSPVGPAIEARRGSLAWDDAAGDLYVGAQASRRQANGTHPAVFRWDSKGRRWIELKSPATGLREELGITGYPGGGCPAVAAHDGVVWAFWWQEGDRRLQGTVYRDGKWQSCAKSLIPEWRQGEGERLVEKDSLGQGSGLYVTTFNHLPQRLGMEAFYDRLTADVVVFAADCEVGLVIRDGKTQPIHWRRRAVADGKSLYSDRLVAKVGWGFEDVVNTGPMVPHTVSAYRRGRELYLHATLCKGGNNSACDVFVYKLTPRPYRDLGLEFGQAKGADRNALYRVERVARGSAGDVAGIRAGDGILGIAPERTEAADGAEMPDRPESDPDELDPKARLLRTIRFADPGTLRLRIERDGKEMLIEVGVADR